MRRLPPWMLGGAPTTGETTSRNRSEPKAPETKTEKRTRKTQKPKEKDSNIHPEEPKRVRKKTGEETKRRKMIQSVTGPEDENLTVDDLLSFAQEYVDEDDDQTRKKSKSLSMPESISVLDESTNMTTSSSQGGTKDPSTEDMLGLLLGPFFKKH